jgi:hypothetical protein
MMEDKRMGSRKNESPIDSEKPVVLRVLAMVLLLLEILGIGIALAFTMIGWVAGLRPKPEHFYPLYLGVGGTAAGITVLLAALAWLVGSRHGKWFLLWAVILLLLAIAGGTLLPEAPSPHWGFGPDWKFFDGFGRK